MSVLVKGMKMPVCCSDCSLYYDDFMCLMTGQRCYDHDLERRSPDCPLVEVPTPHGDLIDAADLDFSWILDSICEAQAVSVIECAPAVIEAEE